MTQQADIFAISTAPATRPFTSRELRAIDYFIHSEYVQLMLSRWPFVDYQVRGTTTNKQVHIDDLLIDYDEHRKAVSREKAHAKAAAKKKALWELN